MRVIELFEGMMKRSDPYISGDLEGPRPISKSPKTNSNVERLAKQAKVDVAKVQVLWDAAKKKYDSKHPKYWAIITASVKRELGLS